MQVSDFNCAVLFARSKVMLSAEGGGVSGIEIALWDLIGKVYGVPCYQFLALPLNRNWAIE